ncbi:MAG: ABC transporter ATP-binding protein [Candidatus Fermentibacter sp.]|nr:ABC transporter ATP-binding protein [Candidatus Fermentibacter sp.]
MARESDAAVSISGLCVDYGRNRVLDGFDMAVEGRTVHGLLGRNGAGKTTTIRAIAGLMEPSRGGLAVLGRQPHADPSVRRLLSILPSEDGLIPGLTITENLVCWARFWGVGRRDAARAASEALEAVGMEGDPARRVGSLSTGNRRLAALARTFMVPSEIVILDEPTSSLDPVVSARIRSVIASMSHERTVILSTHNLEEAQELCSTVTIIHHGRRVFEGPPGGSSPEGRYLLRVDSDAPSWRGLPLERRPDGFLLLESGLPAAETLAGLVREGIRVTEFRPALGSLTEIFMEVAGS